MPPSSLAPPPPLPPLAVDTVEVVTVTRSLRDPVRTAAGTHTTRPICFIQIAGPDGEGWGECGALAGGTLVDPPLAAVAELLQTVVAPELVRTGTVPAPGDDPALRIAWAAAEMAVIDAVGRARGQSLAAWLGVRPGTRVPVGAMVGARPGDLTALLDAADRVSAGGIRRLRVKILPGWDWEPLAALRSRFPDLALQADANGAYRLGGGGPEDAGRLQRLDDMALACIEQPLPPGDLPGSARLAERLRTPVGLDESLRDLDSLRRALAMGACRVACLKPARLGGVAATLEAAARCREAGVDTFVGGFFEAGLGRLANAALAAAGASTLPADLSPPATYLDQDPCGYPPTADGWLVLPKTPGVGNPPRPDPPAGDEGRPA